MRESLISEARPLLGRVAAWTAAVAVVSGYGVLIVKPVRDRSLVKFVATCSCEDGAPCSVRRVSKPYTIPEVTGALVMYTDAAGTSFELRCSSPGEIRIGRIPSADM